MVQTTSLGEQAIAGFIKPVAVVAVEGMPGEPAASVAPQRETVSVAGPLTEREREVVSLIVKGCSNREIAEKLVIAEGTAVRHVTNILNKLDLHSRAQVAVWALQQQQAQPTERLASYSLQHQCPRRRPTGRLFSAQQGPSRPKGSPWQAQGELTPFVHTLTPTVT
jgi:DNA-binding CsgD family transcriptional regulator